MNARNFWLLPCLILPLFSCEKSKGRNQLVYKDSNITLKLKDVHDGRCPEDAICFWAGNAAVELQAEMDNNKHNFTLNTYGINEFNRDTAFWGYHFELLEVSPYPKNWEKKKLKNYEVKVKVELE